MKKDAAFYFNNLLADVSRILSAREVMDAEREALSRTMARRTLEYLRHAGRPTAYEEALLLMRLLDRDRGSLLSRLPQLLVPMLGK